MFRTQSPRDSISVALRKLLQGGERGSQVLYIFLNKGSRQSKQQRLLLRNKTQISSKEFSALLWMGKYKSLGSLNSFLSYAPQLSGAHPVSLFTLRSGRRLLPAFPQFLYGHLGGWRQLLDGNLGRPHSCLEARNHWWLWHFLFIAMAGDIFISHRYPQHPEQRLALQGPPSCLGAFQF